MMVYVVFKEAVYRHESGGVFSTEEAAITAAKAWAANDADAHHEWTVVPFELDKPTPSEKVLSYRRPPRPPTYLEPREADAIFSVRSA